VRVFEKVSVLFPPRFEGDENGLTQVLPFINDEPNPRYYSAEWELERETDGHLWREKIVRRESPQANK
jgi:hypothetical protein